MLENVGRGALTFVPLFFLKNTYFFRAAFGSQSKAEQKVQNSYIYSPSPRPCITFPTIHILTRTFHLLLWINTHWPITTTWSLQCTFRTHTHHITQFTLGAVHAMGFDKHVTGRHHYGILQNCFSSLKILSALPIHPSSPPWCNIFCFLLIHVTMS